MGKERIGDCNTSEARILNIEGNTLSVLVEQKQGCMSCAAASLCEKTSKYGKSIDVVQNNAKDFYVGERVMLNVPQNKIYKALMLAFGYPLLIVAMLCLISYYLLSVNDMFIVLIGITGIVIYYFVLYLCRHKTFFNFSLFVTKIPVTD